MQQLNGWRKHTTVLQIVAGYIGGVVASVVTANVVAQMVPEPTAEGAGRVAQGFQALSIILCMSAIVYLLVVALGVWWVGRIRSGDGMYLVTLMGAFAGLLLIIGITAATPISRVLDDYRLFLWLVFAAIPPIVATLAHNKLSRGADQQRPPMPDSFTAD
jgi:hypothetical protein